MGRTTWSGGLAIVGLLTFGGRVGSGDALPRLEHLVPGAAVGQGPPAGWTHQVIRSVPRLASGALESLPEAAAEMATRFRTVIAAEVARSGPTFRLARVGIGNAIPLGGRDVVVTPHGPDEALASLGAVERLVLRAAEGKLNEARLIARTPTFALLRSPATRLVAGRHRASAFCYAFLVDPETGRLATLVWAMPDGVGGGPPEVIELPPDAALDAALDVVVDRHVGPIPITWSFAMRSLPEGRRIAVPDRAARLLVGAAEPEEWERALRRLLASAGGPSPASGLSE